MKRSAMLIRALAAVLTLSVCSSVFAADGVWTNTVSGNWSDTNNWQDAVIADAGGGAAFSVTTGTINVANDLGTVSLSNITVNADAGYTASWNITGGTNEMVAPAIINVVAGELTFSSVLTSLVDLNFSGQGTITCAGDLDLGGDLIKSGGGNLFLQSTSSSVSGEIQISEGRLLPDGEAVLGGADLRINGGTLVNPVGNDLTLSTTAVAAESGGIEVTEAAETTAINTQITGIGPISKSGAGKLILGGSSVNTDLQLGVTAGNLELNKGGAATEYAVQDLTAVDSGTTVKLTGSHTNQINGGVTLSGGTLDLNGSAETLSFLNSGNPASAVVNNGAALDLTVGEGDADSSFNGTIGSGIVNFTKVGTGAMAIPASAIAYSGTTGVDAGTLRISPAGLPVGDGLAYHLDAANESTITLSGTKVSAWADSSPADVDFSQGNAAQQPEYVRGAINGLPALRFSDSARNRMAGSKTAIAQTVFIVAKTTSFGGLDGIWGRNGGDYGIRGNSLGAWQDKNNDANNGDFTLNGDMYINGVPGNSYDPDKAYILTGTRNSAYSGFSHAIGDYWNSGYLRYFRGYIGEVIVYDRALSAAERAQVESYLNDKWFGLLPSGLSYRLDASDPSTITLDGTKVTGWADATGAGVDFAQSNAAQQPEYAENAINGLPAVRFSDSARNRMYANKDATAQSVFIVAKTTSHGSLDGIWGRNGGDNGIRADALGVWQDPGNSATWSWDDVNAGLYGEMYINGVAGKTYDSAQPYILNSVRRAPWTMTQAIGDYWNSGSYQRYFRGYVGEVLVFSRSLSAAERDQVNAYLSEKWLGTAPAEPPAADEISPVAVASGATLALYANGVAIGTLTGTGEVDVENGVASVANYAGFTGTLTGNGVLALASDISALPDFEMDSIGVAIRNDTPADLDFLISGSGTNTFTGGLQDGVSLFSFTLSSTGSTYLGGLNSTYTGDTTVDAGIASIGGGTVFTKFIRFDPQVMRNYGRNTNSGYQLSEFRLMLNGVELAYPAGTLASAPGVTPDGREDPIHAIDGLVSTKFYVNDNSGPPLTIELLEPMLIDGYSWYTANDAEGRDPVVWTVDISDDGVNWTTVDLRDYSDNQAAINYNRNALVGEWLMNFGGDMNVLSDLSETTVADPAELVLVASETVGSLSGDGDITLVNSTLGLNAFTNATFTGDISGTGSIVKKGSETQALSGVLSVTGEIVVEAGVLDLDGAVLTGITDIIIKAGGELTGSATVNGDLTVTFEGGVYSGTLAVSGSLTTAGTVNLELAEGATYPVNQLLFTYASADQATQDALAAATPPPDLPEGYGYTVRVTDTSARLTAGPAGTLIILQ